MRDIRDQAETERVELSEDNLLEHHSANDDSTRNCALRSFVWRLTERHFAWPGDDHIKRTHEREKPPSIQPYSSLGGAAEALRQTKQLSQRRPHCPIHPYAFREGRVHRGKWFVLQNYIVVYRAKRDRISDCERAARQTTLRPMKKPPWSDFLRSVP